MMGLVLFGLLSFIIVRLWPPLNLAAQTLGLAILALLPRPAEAPDRWIQASLFLVLLVALFLSLERMRRQAGRSERDRQQLAQQLDRRINQLFSLQELSYVLSESLQLERIAEQVTRYAQRFLQSEGAVLALVTDQGAELRVTAAEGSLKHLQGQVIAEDEGTLVMQAIRHERIEVAQAEGGKPVGLLAGAEVRSAAAAPLRAHGFTMGALAVADRRHGPFTTEDLWLLSTVTTHVAVVLANSRLFEMIRQSKEEWETAFNALAEGIAVVDGSGKVRRANRALARLIDVPAPAMIGQPFWEIVIGGAESMAGLMEAAARGERQPPVLVRSDAINRILRLTAAPLSDLADGAAVVVLVEDVTEQQALETKVIQNEKLAAVGQLVSGVAHELNNPLTSIAGLSEFLLERPPIPAPEREHLRVIHEQAERASRIVQNLLTFARKGAPEATTVDLNDVVARTAVLIAYELKLRGIELEQRLNPAPVTIRGDRYELQQVLLNVLTNAAQAVEGHGGAPPRVIVETARDGAHAVVRVQDNGPGVPLHLVPQLFTPFFTTKEPGEGTGLGLSISYGIVESHGGKLLYAP
ncbi:MAG: ATP-binding protein, partial [Gemmatimonadales bacterium]